MNKQVRRFGVPIRYHQHTSSVFVGARLDGLLAPPAMVISKFKLLETECDTHRAPISALRRKFLKSLRKKEKEKTEKGTQGQERKVGVVTRPTSYETC